LITTLADGEDVQPEALVTVKVYTPGLMFVKVIPEPLPLVITLSGLRVTTHEPDGREFRTTLPDATTHVG
jgi:hypothetical protein